MSTNTALLPETTTPAELAAHLGVSERTLRERVRALGAYRLFGKTMILTEEDVAAVMEDARPCQSKSNVGRTAQTGTSQAPSMASDFAVLQERLTKPLHKGSRRKPKAPHGDVISMDRGRT